jgi:DNA-binding NarL/FixJ family response regulator
MPGMNGLEILENVRSSVQHKNLPVIMFSTSSDKNVIEESRKLGASYYMTKSSAFDRLKKSIEHALKINWNTFSPTENNFVYTY